MNDEELLEEIGKGDAQAFREIYLRYHSKVFNLCFYYLQQQQEAEEAMQDVFLQVHKLANKYQKRAKASTWLYRLTVNKCLDILRYQNAKKRLAIFNRFFKDEAIPTDIPRYSDEQTQALYNEINRLPNSQKSAIILTQIQELSIKETALIMGTTPKAVESLLQRAKSNLKKNLKKT